VNRAPFEGTIRQINYKKGEFLNAMRTDTTDRNEANAVWMDTPKGLMTVRQISGLIARRIVCIAKPGDKIAKGQKFGMIKFGSRTELYLPVSAEITTKVGDKVAAGESILARMQ
jgi:phosphatidylserine decarboxylase